MRYRPNPRVTRLLVIDRSPVVIEQLRRDLAGHRTIDLVGHSIGSDDWQAVIAAARPQVVLVDAGLTSVATNLCAMAPRLRLPVIVAVGVSASERQTAVGLLDAGAIDLTARPYPPESISDLVRRCGAFVSAVPQCAGGVDPTDGADFRDRPVLLALAASPGGSTSLAETVASLPSDFPGVVAICPLPAAIIPDWVQRLNRRSIRPVSIASDGQTIEPGITLIAPGDRHLLVRFNGDRPVVAIQNGPAIHHARPSAELLMKSIAGPQFRGTPIAVLLGGAGVDGIGGLAAVHSCGGKSVLESPATSRVPEGSAFAESAGVADRVVPRSQIIRTIAELANDRPTRRAA